MTVDELVLLPQPRVAVSGFTTIHVINNVSTEIASPQLTSTIGSSADVIGGSATTCSRLDVWRIQKLAIFFFDEKFGVT
ncbi:MAG: hypothetical protein R3C05_08595 [Pirellulaceae bacterium]